MIQQEEHSIEGLIEKTTESFKALDLLSTNEQLEQLEKQMKRTSSLLQELKVLSKACEDMDEGNKDKQVFVRRIVQFKAELQDTKDNLYSLVEPRLTPRQLNLLSFNEPFQDPSFDPSIRFFGIDWEQIFGKCFNISISIKIFSQGYLHLKEDTQLDILLLNSILLDLSRLEMDITSHAEAVLNGRLSKSQLRLIQEEQTRLKTMFPPTYATPPRKRSSMAKAKSFRESSGNKRVISKYRKNKTSEFHHYGHRFSSDLTTRGAEEGSQTPLAMSRDEDMEKPVFIRRKSSFMQNVSNLLKNIR
ncbi:uncharacterized protein [Lepeophtheirus salmonis]|uniref:Uncharacterized protein n=1 Tax=Lepeophtheirus salmonis TaxID=72036 RepID=A0A0K2U3R3_LEPSM|nr:uncharacterized protein LOC121124513 [Lepeophtheirus salmonis]